MSPFMKVISAIPQVKKMFENILKIIDKRFGNAAKVFDGNLPLLVLDSPESNEAAIELINGSLSPKLALDYVKAFQSCIKEMWAFLRRGESTAFKIPLVEVDSKGSFKFLGLILKPHLAELSTIYLLEDKSNIQTITHLTYTDMHKNFEYFIGILIHLKCLPASFQAHMEQTSKELVSELLKTDKALTFQSRSVVQPLR